MPDDKQPSIPLGLLIITCAGAMQLLGMGSGLSASSGVTGWFSALNRPALSPPAWVFGPVWALLYAMMGAALALIIRRGGAQRKRLLLIFGIQLVLNLAWTPVFFGLHQIGGALVVIAALFLTLLVLLMVLWKPLRLAALLLLPYFLWVGFATYLNAGYWRLN